MTWKVGTSLAGWRRVYPKPGDGLCCENCNAWGTRRSIYERLLYPSRPEEGATRLCFLCIIFGAQYGANW